MTKLIIVDSESHKEYEEQYQLLVEDAQVLYTTYEDSLIRKVRNFRVVGGLLYHLLMWKKSIDYARKFANSEAEEILCINPLVGLFLGLFNKSNKKIVLAGFLFEPKKNKFYYTLRKKLVNMSLKHIQDVVVYSQREVEYYKNLFPDFKDRFKFVHYGLTYDNDEIYEGTLPEEFIFSGGGSNRDYETLVRAYEETDLDRPIVIATQPWRVPDSNDTRIKVVSDVVVENFGNVLKKSKYLVLSLKNVDLSAGHMVMLQAMDLQVPIIVNEIPSVRDYVNESMVTFYKSGDVKQLKRLLNEFDENSADTMRKLKNAKEVYDKEYTSIELMKRLLNLFTID